MKTHKIIVTDYIEENLDWEAEQLKDLPVEFYALQLKQAPLDELIKKIADADILVVNMAQINADVLAKLQKCKLIIRHGAGYDNVDINAATKHGIQVCYVPDYCQEEVAEQAMMLLLAAFRKFNRQLESMKISVQKGEWDFSPIIPLAKLAGKKVGIIGCGRIGSKVLKMLRGFNADVLVCDPFLTSDRKAELNIESIPLDEVLSQSDLVTIHCSLTPETRGLINEHNLKLMKKNAILINTARGAIVDSKALAKAITENWIAGAAIDVYGKEPPHKNFELIDLQNVILTPHISWYSVDAEWNIREKIIEDIKRHLDGLKPRFPIN
ncbi:C-terminal binding protein [candidate division KSB1 bacterium]|nr:C-terminal binding protein [candidate division KSB1 bacterium]